ncbi:MAG: hypothetical protein AAGG11_07300 [Pseudomonadota bacterium]
MKKDWLQVTTNVGVVIGLVLLIYELNQSRDLTRAQVVDSVYDAAVTRNLALLGENPEAAIARSVFRPDELSEQDAVVLTQFYTAMLVSWMRNKDESGLGYFEESFQYTIASEAYFLNTGPGRRWWSTVWSTVDPDIAAAVDSALANMAPGALRSALQAILDEDAGEPDSGSP